MPGCLAFRENVYGPRVVKVRQEFTPRLVCPWMALPRRSSKTWEWSNGYSGAQQSDHTFLYMTVRFLYGAGPETPILVTGALGKTIKTEVQVFDAEIQTLAVDPRTAVWVSTAEKSF